MKTWTLVKGVRALLTSKDGGVSSPPYASLNLGDHVGDDPACVQKNRMLFAQQMQGARPVFMKQVHGTDVMQIHPHTPDGLSADASMTSDSQVACTMMVADCLPVLLCDAQGQVVAAAHAGWRGLVGGVIENTVRALCQQAACLPSDVEVWLGPCIGREAFEVGLDVEQAFVKSFAADEQFFTAHTDANKRFADLSQLARARLHRLGVTRISGNDGSPDWCTVTQTSKFFSFRRDGVTGRMAACVWREG